MGEEGKTLAWGHLYFCIWTSMMSVPNNYNNISPKQYQTKTERLSTLTAHWAYKIECMN